MATLGVKVAPWAVLLSLVACGNDPPAAIDRARGISGGALAGHLEVLVVDEQTQLPISSTVEVVDGAGNTVGTANGDGPFVFDGATLVAPLTVRVRSAARPQALVGLAGARAVIGVSNATTQRVDGRVLGADRLGAISVVAGALAPVSFVRTDALGRGETVACVPDASGCAFQISAASSSAATIVATLRDADGHALGFGLTSIAAGSAELTLPPTLMPSQTLMVPAALDPPAGLGAVVGVPGLATPAGFVFLEQAPSADGQIVVPELAAMEGNPSWWLIADARGGTGARSVILQRGLRDPSAVGVWPAWLAVPDASVAADGVITLIAVPGATLYAVDWLDASAEVLASALSVDASAPIRFTPPPDAVSIRVRAIDAIGASASSLDLTAAERTITRFSEMTFALTP